MTNETISLHYSTAHRGVQQTAISAFALERQIFYLAILSGFFGPALFTFDFGPFAIFPYRIAITFLWIFFVLRLLASGGYLSLHQHTVRWYLVFLTVWLAYAFISLAWAASTTDAIRNILLLSMGVSVIFFAIHYLRSLANLRVFFLIWLVGSGGLLAWGLWENLTGSYLSASSSRLAEDRLAYNNNSYATFLSLSIPFALVFFRHCRNIFQKILTIGMVLLGVYLLLATRSRANMIAFMIQLFFFFVIILNFRKKVWWSLVAGSALLFMFIFFSTAMQTFFSGWLSELDSLDTEGVGSVRGNLIRNSLLFLWNTAGAGVGAGNAEYYMLHFAKYDTRGILNVHNWWFEILVNYGVVLFAGYLLFFGTLVNSLWKIRNRLEERWERIIGETLLVSLIGFPFASISSSSIIAIKPHWFLFAFSLAFLNFMRGKRPKGKV